MKHLKIQPILFIVGMLLSISLPAIGQRNPKWAQPVQPTVVDNFFKVDNGVYRSGQPNKEAFAELEKRGVKEVLNLRSYHNDKSEANHTSIVLHRIKMKASLPNWDDTVEALQLIKNRKGPIVIHCWHGSDRTGLIVALYRIVFQGWAKEEAIDELENGGYGYHSIYANIKTFIRNLDVEKLKKAVNS